ncbi:DUF262 domain-containing protein [Nitrosomonas sp.]|uniref:DUF262 domain-containing protein n=1 Tax=Nitrosomonas sp. TaxID=42353 RepID=UPI00271E58AC|nr:DUF262 domain-containing protein [Nitrosomonas sp.]MDO8893768.1 DUF262 domain-containing protein [Nitrosomonas sp.]
MNVPGYSEETSSKVLDVDQIEDESGLELENDRGAEIEVPFDPSKIDIIVKPMTISALEDRLENNELDLTPDFQRQANIWNASRKARLIESVLLRIPLPSFYFSEDANGSYAVVDGLQRLCAIFHFMSYKHLNKATGAKLTPLRLEGLQYLKELDRYSFDDLDRKFQRRISELEITANIIRANTPSAVKFNVFARLNQGGMPLNAQEIRNAIFPGVWRDEIREMAEGKIFLRVTEGKIKTQRQQDMELVLRFVALWRLGDPYRRPINRTLDEFLNTTVENELIKWNNEKWEHASMALERSLHAAHAIFGKHVFRKSVRHYYRKPINRGLFEAQLVALNSLSDMNLTKLTERKSMVEEKFEKALDFDEEFIRALLYATGSAEASNIRIQKFSEIFKEVINA